MFGKKMVLGPVLALAMVLASAGTAYADTVYADQDGFLQTQLNITPYNGLCAYDAYILWGDPDKSQEHIGGAYPGQLISWNYPANNTDIPNISYTAHVSFTTYKPDPAVETTCVTPTPYSFEVLVPEQDYETPPPGRSPPGDKQECKKGGYEEFGFENQGLCIKAVNHPDTPARAKGPKNPPPGFDWNNNIP